MVEFELEIFFFSNKLFTILLLSTKLFFSVFPLVYSPKTIDVAEIEHLLGCK